MTMLEDYLHGLGPRAVYDLRVIDREGTPVAIYVAPVELKEYVEQGQGRLNMFLSVNPKDPNLGRGLFAVTDWVHLVIDVDIVRNGPAKQEEVWYAVDCISRIIDVIGREPTMVVFSGNGFHMYWRVPAVSVRNPEVKKEIAGKLRTFITSMEQTLFHQFAYTKRYIKIDTSCTIDLARILRLPGSFNVKYENPVLVTLAISNLDKEYPDLRDEILALQPTYTGDGNIEADVDNPEMFKVLDMPVLERLKLSAMASIGNILSGTPVDDLGFKSRSEAAYLVCARLAEVGCTGDQIYTILSFSDIQSKAKPYSWFHDKNKNNGLYIRDTNRTIAFAMASVAQDKAREESGAKTVHVEQKPSMLPVYDMSWAFENGEPKLEVLLWDEQEKRKRVLLMPFPIKPYFFAREQHVTGRGLRCDVEATDLRDTITGEAIVKVIVKAPSEVRGLRDQIRSVNCLEADIMYHDRVMIDTDLFIVAQPKRKLYYDIETRSIKDKRIISIAWYDDDGHSDCLMVTDLSEDAEREVLEAFGEVLNRYMIMCGWYSGHFDLPVLKERAKELDIILPLDELVQVDLLPLYRDMLQIKQNEFRLGYVAEKEKLETQKLSVDVTNIVGVYEQTPAQLRAYNLADAKILFDLDAKLKLVDILFSIARETRSIPRDMLAVASVKAKEFYISRAIDNFTLYLSRLHQPRMVWPCKRHDRDDDEISFVGGAVMPPVPGLFKNVCVMDFASLYPSIIKTWNIGPETFLLNGPGNKAMRGFFKTEPKSIFVEVLDKLVHLREGYQKLMNEAKPDSQEYKAYDAMQYAMKVLNNSVYGVMGTTYSRYFNRESAEQVTAIGRHLLGKLKSFIEANGYQVLYADTDSSAFSGGSVTTPEAYVAYAKMLEQRIQKYIAAEFNPARNEIKLDVDKIYTVLFNSGKKKRYAGLIGWKGKPYDPPQLKIMGFEYKRSDAFDARKNFQESLLRFKLEEAPMDKVRAFIDHIQYVLMSGGLTPLLVTWKGLNKDFDEYKVVPPQLRVALLLREQGYNIGLGDRVGWIKTGKKPADIIPVLPEMNPGILQLTGKQLEYIWTHYFLPIIESMGYGIDNQNETL